MSKQSWIDEQKEIDGMFSGHGRTSDADKLLEKGLANRNLGVRQAKILMAGRLMGENLGIRCLGELCDQAEYAQLCIDKDSRKDFMKVAIEQWRGKIESGKTRLKDLADKVL